ncbi:MAG: geranylgeranylglycerol-phosphate geranylgeranyltransferase [Gemmatimonadota bacterium]
MTRPGALPPVGPSWHGPGSDLHWSRRLAAGLALVRPVNCGITAVSVAVGALTSGSLHPAPGVLAAMASAALLTGAGNAYNDVMDLEIDRLNRPERPLPSGRLTLCSARLEAAFLAGAGLSMAAWAGAAPALMAGAVAAGLVLYSTWLKPGFLAGNLLVSAMAAAAFPFGAIAAGALGRSWIPAGFAFLFHLGREILKDAEDVEGDRARGARTLALRLGPRRARLVALGVFAALAGATALPAAVGIYGPGYAALVALLDLLLAAVLALAILRPRPAGDQFASRWLTAGMALGLLAIVLGELG